MICQKQSVASSSNKRFSTILWKSPNVSGAPGWKRPLNVSFLEGLPDQTFPLGVVSACRPSEGPQFLLVSRCAFFFQTSLWPWEPPIALGQKSCLFSEPTPVSPAGIPRTLIDVGTIQRSYFTPACKDWACSLFCCFWEGSGGWTQGWCLLKWSQGCTERGTGDQGPADGPAGFPVLQVVPLRCVHLAEWKEHQTERRISV